MTQTALPLERTPAATRAIRGPLVTFVGDPFQHGLGETMRYEADAIVAEIRSHGARPVLLMAWAYQRLGWITMAAATAVALGAGLVPMPSGSALLSTTPQIAYLALPGAFIAVLTWNAAIGLIGAQNAVLFGNLIPVTTFAIEIARGYRPNAVELAGAALTIAALVANNLAARRQAAAPAGQRMDYEYAEAA